MNLSQKQWATLHDKPSTEWTDEELVAVLRERRGGDGDVVELLRRFDSLRAKPLRLPRRRRATLPTHRGDREIVLNVGAHLGVGRVDDDETGGEP
jgi:hypothetical protein